MAQYHKLIISKVDASYGIRHLELALAVMSDIGPGAFNNSSYDKDLEDVVKKGEIVELKYHFPFSGSGLMRSIFFPKGTVFHSLAGKKL